MAAADTPLATRVMTVCPTVEEPVFTGHRMRPLEMAALREPRSFRCGRCDRIHSWSPATAWCEERPRVV